MRKEWWRSLSSLHSYYSFWVPCVYTCIYNICRLNGSFNLHDSHWVQFEIIICILHLCLSSSTEVITGQQPLLKKRATQESKFLLPFFCKHKVICNMYHCMIRYFIFSKSLECGFRSLNLILVAPAVRHSQITHTL